MASLPELRFESTDTLTQDEFAAWVAARGGDDVNRYELVHGHVVMTPPAGYPHGSVAVALALILGPFICDLGLGECFDSSQGFDLPSGDTVAPDFSFVSAVRWQQGPPPEPGRFLRVVPDLAVEILSPSSVAYDRGKKKNVYEKNGVREYWTIDPVARRLVVFLREGDRFAAGLRFAEGERFSSRVVRGIDFDVGSVLRRPPLARPAG